MEENCKIKMIVIKNKFHKNMMMLTSILQMQNHNLNLKIVKKVQKDDIRILQRNQKKKNK